MIAVRTVADPDLPPPRIGNLRHHLATMEGLVFLAARLGGEQAVALDLAAIDPPEPSLPPGIRIASRAELPDMLEQLYEIGLEAAEDIPGTAAPPTFEQWRSTDIDRPTRRPELFFVALAD